MTLCFLLLIAISTLHAQTGENVLLVINKNDAVSRQIADYYRPRRSVPVRNVCTIDVTDVDAAIRRVGELGGTIVVPKMPIPGVGWLAYGNDSEGNIFGIMQMDAKAG